MTENHSLLEAVLHFLDRRRGWCLGLLFLGVGLGAYWAVQLRIEDSPERWMPQSSVEAWTVFDSHFDVGDTIGIGLHFQRPVEDADQGRMRRLREQFAAIEGMKQVYDPSLIAEIEDVSLVELIDPANVERFHLYDRALWDKAEPDRPDRTLLLINELKFLDPNDPAARDELNDLRRTAVREVTRIVEEQRASGEWRDVDFHMASGIVVMLELERRAARVGMTFLPLSVVVGLLSLLIGFRSIRALFVAVGATLFSMAIVFGVFSAAGAKLGVVTITAPTLMSIIAVAVTVHFAAYAADHQHLASVKLRRHLVHWVAVPCLGAASTTAIGFLMLTFNELRPIRELGGQLFLGSLAAF
ncbi:MAG: hypothetical protein N2C14_29265, partial [Planctomycetales bacterium]